MLAARDQENLVHAHQTTAAAKPLNQGIRALQQKTPGNNLKTPFRHAKNDENKPFTAKGVKAIGGDGNLEKNAFVTPLAPRNRAPLGQKTTNAKAQNFKTPAPPQNLKSIKSGGRPSTARKSIKSKIIVAPAQPLQADTLLNDDDDLPDPEFAPVAPPELPDPPMEFNYNQEFPQFQGMNMMRGYGEIYGSPNDESGMSLRLKREMEIKEQYDRDMDQKILDSMKNWKNPDEEIERKVEAMIAAGPKLKNRTPSGIDTLKAKTAASALSQSRIHVPSVAMKSTTSSSQKARKPAFSVLSSQESVPRAHNRPINPSPMRHTAAAALSKNTIGYPKARKPTSIIPASQRTTPRRETDQSRVHPKDFLRLYGEPPVDSDMWYRLREHELIEERKTQEDGDELADELFGTDFFPGGEEGDDDEDVFQLPMP